MAGAASGLYLIPLVKIPKTDLVPKHPHEFQAHSKAGKEVFLSPEATSKLGSTGWSLMVTTGWSLKTTSIGGRFSPN